MSPTDSNNNDKASILKGTREAKGLTLEIVHEATKVPMDALKAIEEGYSSRILSPFYYKGFIKIYAEFLGLDVKEVYRQYGVDQPSKPDTAVPPPSRKRYSSPPAQPNLSLGKSQAWLEVVFKPKNLQLAGKVIGFFVLLFMLFKIGGCAVSRLHQKAAPRKVIVHRRFEKTVPVTRAAAPIETEPKAVTAPNRGEKAEVAIRASRSVWLRVKTDRKVVFETVLRKGSLETWTAKKRIELSGRDLQRLDMEVNGKHIGFLGGGGRRISWVIITPEGLTVKR